MNQINIFKIFVGLSTGVNSLTSNVGRLPVRESDQLPDKRKNPIKHQTEASQAQCLTNLLNSTSRRLFSNECKKLSLFRQLSKYTLDAKAANGR